MKSYQEHLAEDRRLALLRLLKEAGGAANESVLHTCLQQLGHRRGVTREVVRADLDWLKERHLVTVEYFADRVMVGNLTARGLNVANGDEVCEGVKQPSIV